MIPAHCVFYVVFFIMIVIKFVLYFTMFCFETFFLMTFLKTGPSEHPLLWMMDPCINIKYSSNNRHFPSIISTSLGFGTYTALIYLNKVFSVMKSQFNKQSVELSILLTLSKYFTNGKFVFTFDLISSSVESSITKKETLLVSCFLAEELHFIKDS